MSSKLGLSLELSYLTNNEKLTLMCVSPEKKYVEAVGSTIYKSRHFKDTEVDQIFKQELTNLVYARSKGVPIKMKKIKH